MFLLSCTPLLLTLCHKFYTIVIKRCAVRVVWIWKSMQKRSAEKHYLESHFLSEINDILSVSQSYLYLNVYTQKAHVFRLKLKFTSTWSKKKCKKKFLIRKLSPVAIKSSKLIKVLDSLVLSFKVDALRSIIEGCFPRAIPPHLVNWVREMMCKTKGLAWKKKKKNGRKTWG